jgi:hypothetical protein
VIRYFRTTARGKHAKRLPGAGRPVKHIELDNQLWAWVKDQRNAKIKVSRAAIQREAMRIFKPHDTEFRASEGGLESFMNRRNLVMRVPTTVCQKPPVDYASKIANFVVYVARMRQENNYTLIYACDETAVWLDASGGQTVEELGAKEVGF